MGAYLKKWDHYFLRKMRAEVFLGHSVTKHKEIPMNTSKQIDEEIRLLVDRNYKRG